MISSNGGLQSFQKFLNRSGAISRGFEPGELIGQANAMQIAYERPLLRPSSLVGGILLLIVGRARITYGSLARFFNSANARPARRPSLVAVESSSLA